jgi:uncharacterized RDD family membrane protein YckC
MDASSGCKFGMVVRDGTKDRGIAVLVCRPISSSARLRTAKKLCRPIFMKNKTPTKRQKSAPNPDLIKVELAPFWRRLAAWIYDLLGAIAVFILALVIGYLVIYLLSLPWIENGQQVSDGLYRNPLWAIYLLACVQYYYVWCWVKGGQTVGMKTWRLKLCKSNGSHLTWKEAYLRSLLSFGGIAHLFSLVDKEKRGWHDLAVNSRVVVLPKNYQRPDKPLI